MAKNELFSGAGRWFTTFAIVATVGLGGCGGKSNGGGKFEMYLDDQAPNSITVTFMKGRCCGRLTISKADGTADEVVRLAELTADPILQDGSAPTTDQALMGLVPVAGSGGMADWDEDLSIDTQKGPRVITDSAGSWADGAVGPFDENGFEAVALEKYQHKVQNWRMELELVYQKSSAGADAAFHYRNPGSPDNPYWDKGTRIH